MNKIGYIAEYDLELNPQLINTFEFKEATFTRTINSRGDNIRSKLLCCQYPYSDVDFTAKLMKENPALIVVREPFLLDDELREKVVKWVDWANKADRKEYDPFAE